MSIQFGRWNRGGEPIDPGYMEKVRPLIAPYGPDDQQVFMASDLSILYLAFHTTEESRREIQPNVSKAGAVMTLDGRLDNRDDLIRGLPCDLPLDSPDILIVAAAYDEWGADCFAKLVGDWALSIWDAKLCSLILAKDPVGTRHLYYSIEKEKVAWSTILDPLVLFAGKKFTLCEEYLAGWFSLFPAAHLSPYIGIHSVPPSSFVTIRPDAHTIAKYWDFDPGRRIRYNNDSDYEEHFRTVFSEAVRRRIRSDSPILAELSGGMDSSSIVCVADSIMSRGGTKAPRLDTVSYYDDAEPHWNERPYFSIVEQKRCQVGCHIDVSSQDFFEVETAGDRLVATPGAGKRLTQAALEFKARVNAGGYRVLLSGIGGDEFNGGVPTPIPELQNLFAGGEFATLARQLNIWALEKKKPWLDLLTETLRGFLPPAIAGIPCHRLPPSWLDPHFARRNRAALEGYFTRLRFFGPLPTFQENQACLETMRRQMASRALSSDPLLETRYPFLDRNLLEFLCAIPREQLLRPGQRRSLMRRALREIVPAEILNRKRKAYVGRSPILALRQAAHMLSAGRQTPFGSAFGIFDADKFATAVASATVGNEPRVTPLLRALILEFWLAHLLERKILLEDG